MSREQAEQAKAEALAAGKAAWTAPGWGDWTKEYVEQYGEEPILTGYVTFADMKPEDMNAEQLEEAIKQMVFGMEEELTSKSPESVTLTAREFGLIDGLREKRKQEVFDLLEDL